jgi:CubicO group peptidase (beta-lactamase class C family)
MRIPALFTVPTLVAGLLLPASRGGAFAPDPAQTGPAASDSASLAREVDALFQRWHRPDSPGAAVLVVRDGKVVHLRGYGMANLEHGVPMAPSTVLDVASVSKQFGAMAVALLEADGWIGLDDPVRRHLPELPEWGDRITLRHLVHHTSGLRDWPGTLGIGGWDFQDVISFSQILRMAERQEDLNFPPGSDYAYSNTGYNLLAEVVARVTGQSFREWTEERMFRPLGMTRTHFHDDHTEVIRDRADSYAPRPEGGYRRVTNNLTALGSSSLHTTVEDLARWIANFDDPVVGDPSVIARVHERGVLGGGDTITYAFGQVVESYRGLPRVSHGGSWAGFRSVLHRYPGRGFAVAILGNTAEMVPSRLAEEIADLYLAEHLGLPPEEQSAAPAGRPSGTGEDPWAPGVADLAEYEGRYEGRELDTWYHLQVRGGVLVARHFRTGDRPLNPWGPDRFEAPGLGEVRFLRDEVGRVIGFTANSVRVRHLRFDRVP